VDELSQSILKIKKQIISYTKLDSDERQQVRSQMQEAMKIAD
jgi:hypothetical protein